VAIFATIFGALGRFAGKLLTAVLGWASTLLFGRVSQDKQILLVLMTFGSVVWVVLLLGVVFPEVGTFLLAFVPIPDFVDENLIRLAMLIAALIVPLLIGTAALFIQPTGRRATGTEAVKSVLRGYPLALVLALVLVFLAAVAIVRKVRALIKRWKDAHVAIVVREGGYDRMVGDLEQALDQAGLEVTRGTAPTVLAVPGRVLGAVAGSGVRSLVPDRLVQLNGRDLEIQLYPSDVALAGKEAVVNRARAAMASRLASTSAFMTTSAEAQAVEEKLQAIAHGERIDERTQLDLLAIDDRLARLEVPYEEWEVLYRQRLQIERDLLTGRTPGAVPGEAPGTARAPVVGPDAAPPSGVRLAVESVIAGGTVALLVLDLVLALRERAGR
jgi:hypothetical protein